MIYYSTQRPISIGTYPHRNHVTEIVGYDAPRYIEEIGHVAYGHIDYADELTADEQDHYSLYPAARRDERLDKIIRALARFESDPARFDRAWSKAKRLGYTDEQLATAYSKA